MVVKQINFEDIFIFTGVKPCM